MLRAARTRSSDECRAALQRDARQAAIARAERAETALDAERAERRALTDRLTSVQPQPRPRNRTAVTPENDKQRKEGQVGTLRAARWSGLFDAVDAETVEFLEWGEFARDPFDCLLYTSDAADDLLCVDLGGRRIIK